MSSRPLAFLTMWSSMLLAGVALPAFATPSQTGVQGILFEPDGAPAEGTRTVTFSLYDGPTASQPIWSEALVVELVDGRFAASLPASPSDVSFVAALEDAAARELAVSLEDGVELDRRPLTAAPFASVATRASNVPAAGVRVDNAANRLGGDDAQAALEALEARIRALESSSGGSGGDGLPPGAILAFLGPCPSGWTAVDALAGRMPIGASVTFPLGQSGGAASHTHTLAIQDGGAHGHDLGNVAVDVDYASNDRAYSMVTTACANPNAPGYSANQPWIIGVNYNDSCAGSIGAATPYHRHRASLSGRVSQDGAHSHTATAAEASSMPPWHAVSFCAKP